MIPYEKGGFMGLPADYKLVKIHRYGEYIYADKWDRTWYVKEHADGWTRTRLVTPWTPTEEA